VSNVPAISDLLDGRRIQALVTPASVCFDTKAIAKEHTPFVLDEVRPEKRCVIEGQLCGRFRV